MPAIYDNLGIHFLYPDNWTLDEEESPHGNNSVTVQAPGGAFWSIVMHPPNTDPTELAATALQALKSEYPDSEAEPVREEIAHHPLNGYDMSFFYLDFTNTAAIRCFRTATATCLVLCQAEDREFTELAPVFRAMLTSLLSPQ